MLAFQRNLACRPLNKAAGIVLAITGIAWHSWIGLRLKAGSAEAAVASIAKPDPEVKPLLLAPGNGGASLRPSSTSSATSPPPQRGSSGMSGLSDPARKL